MQQITINRMIILICSASILYGCNTTSTIEKLKLPEISAAKLGIPSDLFLINAKRELQSAESLTSTEQNNLGLAYLDGRGIEQNTEQGVLWLLYAAEQGNTVAQDNVGMLYWRGIGVKKNEKRAAFWFMKAAEQGYQRAQRNLSNLYFLGRGVDQSIDQAVIGFNQSARKLPTDRPSNAMYSLNGLLQEDREPTIWNETRVQALVLKANSGDLIAQNRLGLLYLLGVGLEQNIEKGLNWIRLAAEASDIRAQDNLSRLYLYGIGVEHSIELAGAWGIKARTQRRNQKREMLTDTDFLYVYDIPNFTSIATWEGIQSAQP